MFQARQYTGSFEIYRRNETFNLNFCFKVPLALSFGSTLQMSHGFLDTITHLQFYSLDFIQIRRHLQVTHVF